jgi:micrococcal nuclease
MANMLIPFFGLALILLMIFPAFPMESYGHRSGCHAAHSCPSDTGSYVCADTGNYAQCPGNDSENNEENTKKKKTNTKSNSNSVKSDPALPSNTISEGIEISGPVTNIVDGDTLDINDIRIRLSLVNTPEVGESGFDSAKDFVESLCLDKNGQVDIDDGQRQGSFGREIGVVYCDGVNLNSELMSNGYALISAEFCDVSEFASQAWASSSCKSDKSSENTSPGNSNKGAGPLSTQERQNGEVPNSNPGQLNEGI